MRFPTGKLITYRMKFRIITTLQLLFIASASAWADEGMWMINTLNDNLMARMYAEGLQLEVSDIYNPDGESITDAIVALDFIGTGSLISKDGLLITNHHVAYSDVHELSTGQNNYLENGFFADERSQEIPIKGKSAYILKSFTDVTDEVNQLMAEETAAGRGSGFRRISHLIEEKYNESTGLEASVNSMWQGSRYYLSLYQVYSDVRLVASPPVSIAAFGGDIDNWEWPQHKCDFAMYRIYTAPDGSPAEYSEDNVPLHPKKYLKISTDGYKPGDFSMVLGFPGKTDRYASSAKVNFTANVSYPISNRLRSEQMEIIMKWMNSDPAIRLMYADKYFSLSNTQENNEGFAQCINRFDVVQEKKDLESQMKPDTGDGLFRELDSTYEALRQAESDLIYYRETFVRGSSLALTATRLKNVRNIDMDKEYEGMDMRVEKELFKYAVKEYYSHVSKSCWGPFQTELADKFQGNWDALAESLWLDRHMTKDDPIFTFFTEVQVRDFNDRIDSIVGDRDLVTLNREYTHMLYNWRNGHDILQYPDANSTLRLTFGQIKSFERDGEMLPWRTLPKEILEKENPEMYDFTLKPEWRNLLERKNPGTGVNFISDNDITGGNSGSPVLNAKGEIIGLAFDGNKESLAGDVSWTRDYNRCVNVDIRFVMWTLKKYAKTKNILKEIKK